jgi:hypothetical protein
MEACQPAVWKVPVAESYRFMTQFQEMSRNYLTPDNQKAKPIIYTGRLKMQTAKE